jgi:DNA-directed RNA polymerase specialized sigma24 family protein
LAPEESTKDNRDRNRESILTSNSPASLQSVEQLFHSFLEIMKDKGLTFEELTKLYYKDQENIPIEVFTKKLSPSEAVCKYLKENLRFSYHEIAEKLNRDDRSVWTSYQRAAKKQSSPIKITRKTPSIPLTILKNRSLSFLENITHHLHQQGLKPKQIALVLNRKAPIIHTVLSRAKRKMAASTKTKTTKKEDHENTR